MDERNKQIITLLREKGDYVSGQELCERFDISRTAIWKRIRALEEEGYSIEAVKNRGYKLTGSPDSMQAHEVETRLHTKRMGRPVYYFDSIDSTNLYAKKLAEEGAPEGALVIADEQTAGRGRLGHNWTTPKGTAIAMTVMLRPDLPLDRIAMVTLVVGMALTKAVRELYDLPVGIKWPNDLVVNGRKLSGTLTEMSAEITKVSYIVIGVGINANVTQFPEELKDTATSLCLELGQEVNRAELIALSMNYFEQYYEVFCKTGDLSQLKDEYNEYLLNLGRVVRVMQPGEEFTGTAEGIDEMGQLLVRKDDGELVSVYAGEVHVRGVYGYV